MAPEPSAAAAIGAEPATPFGTEVPDEVLVTRLIAGSEAALAALYDRHAQIVLGVAARLTGDRSTAEEVVQETFLALWDHAETFDATRGSLRTWLLAIARNRAIDRTRARQARPSTVFSAFGTPDREDGSVAEWLAATAQPIAMAAPAPGPDDEVLGRETRATLAAAIAGLAPDERRVLELAYGSGLSQSEVATHLGWPLGTVKTRTRRALRRLREVLEAAQAAPSAATVASLATRPCPVPCGSSGGARA